jgi:chitosanase
MRHGSILVAIAATMFACQVTAKNVPSVLKALYSKARSGGDCTCADALQTGFYNTEWSGGHTTYCTKYLPTGKGFYLKGPGSDLANMDIDCDGEQSGDDGRCKSSTDTQGQTRWGLKHLEKHRVRDLNANIHPYVVLGNEGSYSPTFDPRTVGVEPLSIVAVVCGDELVYGVWGDTNGDDNEHPMVGEASLALATSCYGSSISGNSGHDEADVLYIAFAGKEAVPARAKWDADSYEAFEESITAQGDKLVAQLFGDKSTATGGSDLQHTASSGNGNSDSDNGDNNDDNSKHNLKSGGALRSTIPRVCHIILVASVALFGLA